MKQAEMYQVAVERGAGGFSAAWCLNLPGCYALVPPNADLYERSHAAILELAGWAHFRAADRLTVPREAIEVVQVLDTGEELRAGRTSAFFLFDGQPATGREFPVWANTHDRAHDEFRDFVLGMPVVALDDRFGGTGRTPRQLIDHAAGMERFYAAQLDPAKGEMRKPAGEEAERRLRDAHMSLQEVVCAVPPDLRTRRNTSRVHGAEEWSVRKVMRLSTWHLRYHLWELRRALSAIWLASESSDLVDRVADPD